MTAHARLLQLRRSLLATLAVRAVLIGAAVALGVLAVGRVAGLSWAGVVGALAGVITTLVFLARVRAAQSLSSVALWVEERTPQLRYALVTVADGVQSPVLERQALTIPWWTDAQSAQRKSLLAPVVAAVAASVLAIWAPAVVRSVGGLTAARSAARGGGQVVDVLASIHVTVTPPRYAGVAPSAQDDPTSIEALVGSAITLSGKGDARSLTATADSSVRSVAQRGEGWSLSLSMPTRPAIIRLHSAAGRDRLIVLAPITDAAPAVTLLLPARDTIVRRAAGSVRLHAQLRDDIGLRDATFELVITSGGGENFTFRTGTVGRVRIDNALETTLDARLSLDSLKLEPGDILQLRAVARDGNTVNGPGLGASETRALRVARADEYDSVSVEALPPPEEEQQVLSQRMLINLTEALVRKQRSLSRPALVSESQRIAADQKKLRKRVGDVVFQRLGAEPLSEEGSEDQELGKLTPEQLLAMADSATGNAGGNVMDVEGDETPILAINKPLLEAFNAMWDAGRALEVGEPAKALPPMRIALAAIQKARLAERIYLRGKPSTQIVDLSKVRLTGKDKGSSSIREARLAVDPVLRRRNATFERVTALIARNPDAAADSLLLMRVEALGDAPALATALDEAARALRRRDTTAIPLAWTRVRRALGGAPVQHAGVSAWLGMP